MAKLVEEILVIKLSRMVRDSEGDGSVISAEQREVLSSTLPSLVEEVLGESAVMVELADLG
jgi:hypothetical protein